jgi:hypothetical protein
VVAVLLAVLPVSPRASESGQQLEIKVCDFAVPPELAKSNATFTAIYSVEVDRNGRPTKIEKVKNDFLQDDPFAICIRSWILPAKNKRLLVSFEWRHGQGWTQLTISGDDLSYRIGFEPGAFGQYGHSVSGP